MTQNNRLWRCLFFSRKWYYCFERFYSSQYEDFSRHKLKKQASILAEIIVLYVSPFLLDIFALKVAEK